ncbi:hypothetical protein P7K49_023870 [Saguinus oedipus]|uniref:Uncharacterized protein n=1 Tax=Saguinus oedipus TaxID=9490 RepID=A0ABQ9UN04_SAGOE|nr:hypothetical protein P7K49_023870 [Saguinus oedipus]
MDGEPKSTMERRKVVADLPGALPGVPGASPGAAYIVETTVDEAQYLGNVAPSTCSLLSKDAWTVISLYREEEPETHEDSESEEVLGGYAHYNAWNPKKGSGFSSHFCSPPELFIDFGAGVSLSFLPS